MTLHRHREPSDRSAFTMIEMTACIVVLGTVLVILAQTSIWQLRERWRNTSRQLALELAANVLEAARAEPWDALTAQWAEAQKLPPGHDEVLSKGRLAVRLEQDAKLAMVKRITVEVHWEVERNLPESVQLVTLIGPRSTKTSAESP